MADQSSEMMGNPIPDPESVIKGDKYRLTVLTTGLFRLEYAPDGDFEDRASTFAVNRNLPKPECRFKQTGSGVELVTDRMRVSYDGKALSASGLHVVLTRKKDGVIGTSEWRYGQHDAENLGGTARTLDDVNGRCDLGSGIVSKNGISVIDDTNSMLFSSDGWVTTRSTTEGRSDIYVFGYGSNHREALQAFYAISGKAPVLPRWALGNWWSRYYAYTDKSYLEVMDRFKSEGIPLSVGVIDMDWYPGTDSIGHLVDIPPEYGAGWTGYTWNKELFPDHVGFLKQLKDRGLKVSLNTHPADGIRPFEDCYERMCKALGRDPSNKEPVEFDSTDRKFFDAYLKAVHHPLEDEGVDFWWMDWQQGQISKVPGIDPLWVLNHFHFLDSQRRLGRRMTFSRFAGPGSQRYPIGFSGDSHITWDSLHFQPEFTATASNIGYGWWSHDIGGHYHGEMDDELLARWTQVGLFSPILRLHSSDNPFLIRAPWLRSPETRKIMTHCMQYRHRLIPYLYTMSIRATREGRSLVEPMYYDHPSSPDAYRNKNQYLFGSQLLVSPITTKKAESTNMGSTQTWLPAGRYVDIFTGTVYDGDRVIGMHRPMEGVPVLALEGSILPLDRPDEGEVKNGAPLPEAIEIILVVGKDGHFELLEDDGGWETLEKAVLASTPITFTQETGEIKIGPTSNPLVKHRKWSVQLPGIDQDSCQLDSGGSVQTSISTDQITGHVTIAITESVQSDKGIIIKLGSEPRLRQNDIKGEIKHILEQAQIKHDTKWALWNVMEERLRPKVLMSRLRAVEGVDEELMDAMMEFLLAQE